MNTNEKRLFTSIADDNKIGPIIHKLTLNKKLDFEDSSYILGVAMLLLNEYKIDPDQKGSFEFGYYIVLKYSIIHDDYKPLYDIALNYGFYPIAKYILDKGLLDDNVDLLSICNIQNFTTGNLTHTYMQKEVRQKIFESDNKSISYVAPTSFGKSSLIYDHLLKNIQCNKACIIVPTKSLLMQTALEIRKMKLDRKIIMHDSMYDGDEKFVAVLTQERALRLMRGSNISFDLLYIDEAHNLFTSDNRNILLSRVIRQNKARDSESRTIYLSPLIANSDNLSLNSADKIEEQRIDFNMKELEIYELNDNKQFSKYNRFLNKFYNIGVCDDIFSCIYKNGGKKNFIYLSAPKKIEDLSKDLFDNIPTLDVNDQMEEMINQIKKHIHADFKMIDFLRKGILYLHGAMPDNIKGYLEYKYKKLDCIKYLVANSVILEGINMPIDSLFVVNAWNLDSKRLTNLTGRVNRLNAVFDYNEGDIKKLLPNVFFLGCKKYNKGNMVSVVEKLRSRYFNDVVKNPMLDNYKAKGLSDEVINKNREVVDCEKFLDLPAHSDYDKFKKRFIEEGLHKFYDLKEKIISTIYNNLLNEQSNPIQEDLLNKISNIFLKGVESTDYEIQRLSQEKAKAFYRFFLESRKVHLKSQITSYTNYLASRKDKNDTLFYIGTKFGEIPRSSYNYKEPKSNAYIDISTKSDAELVNIAIIKIKLEEDFVSFKLRKFIEILYEYDIISEEDYNYVVFGTTKKEIAELQKIGMSRSLLVVLENAGQLKNIEIDKNYNIQFNQQFYEYYSTIDDYYKYELDRIKG